MTTAYYHQLLQASVPCGVRQKASPTIRDQPKTLCRAARHACLLTSDPDSVNAHQSSRGNSGHQRIADAGPLQERLAIGFRRLQLIQPLAGGRHYKQKMQRNPAQCSSGSSSSSSSSSTK